MKKFICIITLFIFTNGFAQPVDVNPKSDFYKNAPLWAQLMYQPNSSVQQIDSLYTQYWKANAYKKTYHTQYYKRWRKTINPYLNNQGIIETTRKNKIPSIINNLKNHQVNAKKTRAGNWSVLGPFKEMLPGGLIKSGARLNVYTMGRCEAFPAVMYCGTESGEVYKSTDGADNWVNVSNTLVTAQTPDAVTANVGINALAVHPTNSNIVYIGSGNEVFKTTNGGTTWNVVFTSTIALFGYKENPAELLIHSSNPQIVLVAGKEGIYRTANGGSTWVQVLTDASFDIKAKPGNANTLYAIRKNVNTSTQQFLISTNAGLTWVAQTNGWYTSSDPARYVEGARIAVSAADSNRVYAYLIGGSKSGDDGFIGIYRSNNGGVSWVNTMSYDGSPYSATHPNLIVSDGSNYNQGFYNCAIMASNTNANEILVGGIGMWRSNDGGQTFQCVYNYVCGNYNPMHVDMQDFRAFGNDYWASTDGGIYKSTDFFNTQPEYKMDGIHGVDFWGFGAGWNRDILVGGTFHNGVDVYDEGFGNGTFIHLVGGEPASGYVNPGQARVYSTGMGSRIIPQSLTATIENAPFEQTLNEDAWFAESSELKFHPSCHNIMYKGYTNKLFKSIDGGETFTSVYAAAAGTKVLGIEISRTNTSKMYIVIVPTNGAASLVKTTDDWASNTIITLPNSNNLAIISIDPENDEIITLAYPRGSDGDKVFKSTDGGANWINQTSSTLDAQNIQSLACVGGTNGGVYIGTSLSCYYKNNSMNAWAIDNINLPSTVAVTKLIPFYRDGKIRMASYGKGIWESPLYEAPTKPLAKIMVDKLTAKLNCNVFFFDDYSTLNHANATWQWTFEHANISTSTLRNPQVIFNTVGNHLVTLKVTNANQISSIDSLIVSTTQISPAPITQNFELDFLRPNLKIASSGNFSWKHNDTIGAFGLSNKCMSIDNFSISDPGKYADYIATANLSTTDINNATLTFDVAYAEFSSAYQDSLQVLVSIDCGATFTMLYTKGGAVLSTTALPITQTAFSPTATEWRKDSVNLAAYIGNENVIIKFRNINQYGQALYVDNINIPGLEYPLQIPSSTISETENFTLYPNPVSNNKFISIEGKTTEAVKFNLYNVDGKLIDNIFTKSNTAIPLEKYNLTPGIYLYTIITDNKILKGKLIITDK